MWQEREYVAPGTGWSQHYRFLTDLFAIRTPTTWLDLTNGDASRVVRATAPNLVPGAPPADLVVANSDVPDVPVGEETLVLISGWNGGTGAVELPNGLAVVAGSGWSWLTTHAVRAWLRTYTAPSADDQTEFYEARITELQHAIRGQEQRIELLEEQLLSARDEIQQLLPLEVSPKAQLAALRRSIPVSVRKRMPRRRGRDATASAPLPPSQDPALKRLKGRTVQVLLGQQFDATYAGRTEAEYVAEGLRKGEAVNALHAQALEALRRPAEAAAPWGAVELVTADGRTAGELPGLLDQADASLVTVDVWDTLIVRDRPADAAKLATARRMILRPGVATDDVFEAMAVRVAVEAELAATDPMQEYLLADVLKQTVSRLSGDPGAVSDLVAAEVADEIAWTRARPDVAGLYDQPTLAIASDFYMDAAQLRSIVAAADPRWSEVPVYVSVERGASKRLGGGLLDLIRHDLGVPASKHLHVGDNVHSDITMQVKAGGTAIQVQPHGRFAAAGEFGPEDLPACDEQLQRRLAQFSEDNPVDDIHRTAGRAVSPLAVAVVAAGLEQAYRTGVDRVHYVSREGIFLARVHETVEETLRPPGAVAVKPVHLALSRRATFGASLEVPYRFSLQRMWSMYAKQSPRAMLVSIGVEPQDFHTELAKAGLGLDEVLSDARRDQRIEAFLADPQVEAKLSAHVEQARDLLRRYVLGESQMTAPFIVADVGWRGTIQDNLVRALGIPSSYGVYFGLFPFLNAQPPGSHKIGVAFDGNLGEDFDFADPPAVLERPWTPDVNSTIGFHEVDGQVVPHVDKETGHVSPGIASFQQGSLEVAPLVAQWMSGFGLTTGVLRPQIARWAYDLWQHPPPGVADIWFSSDHDDSFGALNHTEFGKDRPGPDWLNGDLYRHITRGMADSGWPQGYLAWRPVASLIELGRL